MEKEIELADKDPEVDMKELTTNIYVDNDARNFCSYLDYIRGRLY